MYLRATAQQKHSAGQAADVYVSGVSSGDKMKTILITLVFILISCSPQKQHDRPWLAFRDVNTDLIGFKDQHGNTKVEPKYMGLTIAKKLDKIAVVMEQVNEQYDAYYLTKFGKKVGRNKIYMFDNTPDCESEGFIRFENEETDTVGMYNAEGEIAIPAVYNSLTSVRNGLITALRNAKKDYWEGNEHSGCNHYSWVGGEQLLIDTDNNVLVENFGGDWKLDLYSLKILPTSTPEASRRVFPGIDGNFYSFVDFEQEFEAWFQSVLLESLGKAKLIKNSHDEIYIWRQSSGWTKVPSIALINNNYALIKNILAPLKTKKSDYSIFLDGLNPYIL